MIRTNAISTFALAVALGWALPVQAQTATDFATMKAQMEAMQAQLDAMKSKVDALQVALVEAQGEASAATTAAQTAAASAAKATQVATKLSDSAPKIAWKGAPEFSGKDGWSFKPRGRFHYDVGVISTPGKLVSPNLGYASRVRRARIGMEGTVPGGFGYKVDVDFANAGVGFGDVWLSYTPENAPVQIRLGNFETLNSLEQISSSNFVTFIERASFNDAFLNARRLGGAVAVRSKNDDLRGEIGLFAAHTIDSSLDNDGWIGAARLVYAPKALGGQLHFAANFQHRDFASNSGGVASTSLAAPSVNQLARYRARPNTQLTDLRFVDTGSFAARRDRIVGVEAAAIFKGVYFAGEAQWLKASAYEAGDRASGLAAFGGGNIAVTPSADPGFFGGYAEVGYFLTGETRGYSRGAGTWGRTKVLNPINQGGAGAFQVAARMEHLDLDDSSLIAGPTNNFTTGLAALSPLASRLGRGGKQNGYLLALNWQPVDYVRFMVNYGRINIEGGPLAAQVDPFSSRAENRRKYGLDLLQTRMQIEF